MMLKSRATASVLAAVFFLSSHAFAAGTPRGVTSAPDDFHTLRRWMQAARERAPEVSMAQASSTSSRAALESARLAPFGNPYLEVTAERGGQGVTKDLTVNGTLWMPMELSGQGRSRGREAQDFVLLHGALLEQARASAAARLLQAYGLVVVATERKAVLVELLANARSEADLLAERMKRGDAIRPDASLAGMEVARQEVLLAETEADLVRGRADLARVVGRDEVTETLGSSRPPSLSAPRKLVKGGTTPHARALAAEAHFHASAAERWRREGKSTLSVGLSAGRGDYGETRLGGGVAYAFPTFRTNRPESARAAAESVRASTEQRIYESVAERQLRSLRREQEEVTAALAVLTSKALPAAEDAVRAVRETYAAGKVELLSVLLSQRELSTLSLRRLELLARSWQLVAEYVEIAGDLP